MGNGQVIPKECQKTSLGVSKKYGAVVVYHTNVVAIAGTAPAGYTASNMRKRWGPTMTKLETPTCTRTEVRR